MKNKTTKLTSALLALLTAGAIALPVSASTEDPTGLEMENGEPVTTGIENSLESESAEDPADSQHGDADVLPDFDEDAMEADPTGVPSGLQDEAAQSAAQSDEAAPEESVADQQGDIATTKKKSSDVPLFVGAGLAVLTLGGVALVCKTKGNK